MTPDNRGSLDNRPTTFRASTLQCTALFVITFAASAGVLMLFALDDPIVKDWRTDVERFGGTLDHPDPTQWPADWPPPEPPEWAFFGPSAVVEDRENNRQVEFSIDRHEGPGLIPLRVAAMRSRVVWQIAPQRKLSGHHELRVRWRWDWLFAVSAAVASLFVVGYSGLRIAHRLLKEHRGRKRILRGLCPRCAFPLGESDVCAECGYLHRNTKAPRPTAATSPTRR